MSHFFSYTGQKSGKKATFHSSYNSGEKRDNTVINVRKWFKVKPSQGPWQGQSVVASAGCTGANLDLHVVQRHIHTATYYPTTAGEYRLDILGGTI